MLNESSLPEKWEVFFYLMDGSSQSSTGLSPWHHATRDRFAEIEPNDSSSLDEEEEEEYHCSNYHTLKMCSTHR